MKTGWPAALALAAVLSAPAAAGVMSGEETEKKREGVYCTPLPLFNYSSDAGFGLGAGLYVFFNGRRTDRNFARTPYFTRLYLQYLGTDGGREYDTATLDMPYLAGSRYRLRAQVIYERDNDWKYFGGGGASHAPLPAGTYSAYRRMLAAETPLGPGSTNAAYHRLTIVKPAFILEVEREMLPGLKTVLGAGIERAAVGVYDYARVRVDGESRMQGPTMLSVDSPTGTDGGWANYVKTGVAWDTRDFEPAPKRGWFTDLTLEFSDPALGSRFSYSRETGTVRRYLTVLPGLVFAGRGSFSVFQGDPPFFTMGTLGFFDARPSALGGGRTIRGFKERRFLGRATALANVEARYDIHEHTSNKQRFLYTLVAFGDAGRPFSSGARATLRDWRAAAGGGLRIAWNQATIVNATCGRSGEDANVFVDFGHQF